MVTIFTLFFNVLELEILLYDYHATKTAFASRKRSGRISDKNLSAFYYFMFPDKFRI